MSGVMKSFSSRVEAMTVQIPEAGCWIWMGAISKRGYGKVSYNGKLTLAHRASYMEFVGDIEPGLYICHRCDVKSCVNPHHLYKGTHLQNTEDALARGQTTFGEKNSQAKLKEDAIPEIRAGGHSIAERQALAEKFKVSVAAVRDVQRGKRWSHVQ